MQSKVLSSELKTGMFVSSLDRPWIDTPFMLQGFLIENDDDIKLLRQYCEFVQVDWDMSTLLPPSTVLQQALKATQAAAPRQTQGNVTRTVVSTPQPASASEKNDAPIGEYVGLDSLAQLPPEQPRVRIVPASLAPTDKPVALPEATNDFEQGGFIDGITGKFKSLFKRNPKAPKADIAPQQHPDLDDRPIVYERPDFIPYNVTLSTYVDASLVEAEIKPAIQAHKQASEMMKGLVQDIQSNKNFTIEKAAEVVNEVVNSMVRNPDAMLWIARLRKQDEAIYGHGLQVAVYLVALGRHLGLPKEMLERLCTMGLLLDMGKVKLPKTLLLKKDRLTTDEFEIVKSHVQLSLSILKETPDLHPDVLLGIAQHHEREDGSGYPAGLSKDEISLFGRMSAITDSFAALTNPRSYAKTMPAYEALQTLSGFNPGLYQATMIEQFIQAIGVFPVGSMVELSSGEVAIVIGHSKVRRLKPRVLIISDADKQPAPQATTLDLMSQSHEMGDKSIYIQRGLPTGAYGLDAQEYYLS